MPKIAGIVILFLTLNFSSFSPALEGAELVKKTQEAQATAHEEEAHAELPNVVTVLRSRFPENRWLQFLHRWENAFFSLLIALLIGTMLLYGASRRMGIPRGISNLCEFIVEGLDAFVSGILGEHGRQHLPFLGTLFLYILFMNWSGLVPLMKSSTASWSTTAALALAVVVYVQYTGIRAHGVAHYLAHMAGNPKNLFGFLLIPLMFVINMTIEFLAVPLSLSLRLFANISSEDKLLFKFAELTLDFKGIPFLLQLFANVLAITFSLVQAFVFLLLSTVYISLILPHEERERAEPATH